LLPDFGVALPADLDLLGFRHQDQLPASGRRVGRASDGNQCDDEHS